MAEQFPGLTDAHRRFIEDQKVFFVATAAPDGHVNLSPKGGDAVRVLDAKNLIWLNATGSGNETAAHILQANRITMMWCAFEGSPRILRVYGTACAVHPQDEEWPECTARITPGVGARQYFRVRATLVQTSCGYGVPLFDYLGEREALDRWAEKRGPDGIADYWQEKNTTSIDGFPTGMEPVDGQRVKDGS